MAIEISNPDKKDFLESNLSTAVEDAPAETVEIHLVPLDPGVVIDRLLPVLSADELQRTDRIPVEQIRRRYVLTRVALRRLLGERLAVAAADLRFEYGERGKPRLAGGGIGFNVSHSGDLALIAISGEGALGVDLEQIRPARRLDLLSRRVLTSPERELLSRARTATARSRGFFRFWTAKEAVAKSFGLGLALAPRRITVLPDDAGRALAAVAPAANGPLPDGAEAIPVSWLSGLDAAVGAVATSSGRPVRPDCRRYGWS
jgi:4'-phosphopantetheinyl transferase